MSDSAIYDAVRRRTKTTFGFGVNLHWFRHAAGCFWSIQDSVNVRGVKDLMGHASYDKTTEKYYVMGLGCVKTCTREKDAEVFSLSSSPDCGRERFCFSN
jgi:hypothetical protein